MDQRQYEKLKEYIEAMIDEKLAKDTSDGGLIEAVFKNKVEKELDTLMGFYGERDW